MIKFLALVSGENRKLWKMLSTRVMLLILVAIILGATGLFKYYSYRNSSGTTTTNSVSANWKDEKQQEINEMKAQLSKYEKGGKLEKIRVGGLKKEIAEQQYRVDHNIPNDPKSIFSKMTNFDTDAGFGYIIALMLIIACTAVVAGEFSEGTIKMIISRPYRRWEILSAKLIVTLLYGLVLVFVTFALNFLAFGVFFGFDGMGAKEMLWTGSRVLYVPAVLKTLSVFGLDFLQVIFFVFLAFALSAIFRSRSIATGFSLVLLLFGTSIAQMVGVYFSWGKYLPFGTSGFTNFITNGSYIYGTSLGFALVTSAIYAALFIFAGYFTFSKRDI